MPDSTILERLQALDLKVDSPERLAMLQAFGREHYADADFLNLVIEALITIFSGSGGSTPTLQQVTTAGNSTNNDLYITNEKRLIFLNGAVGSDTRGVAFQYIDEFIGLSTHEEERPYSFPYNGKYVNRSVSGIPADNKGNVPFGNSFLVTEQFGTPQTNFTLNEIKGRTGITTVIFNGMVESDPYNNIPGFTANFVTGVVTSDVPFYGSISFIILI